MQNSHMFEEQLPLTSSTFTLSINNNIDIYNKNLINNKKNLNLCRRNRKNFFKNSTTLINQIGLFIIFFILSALTIANAETDSHRTNLINYNDLPVDKRIVSYVMMDGYNPFNSYIYSFYPLIETSEQLATNDNLDTFRTDKRDGKQNEEIPGVLRFGKRIVQLEDEINGPAKLVRFGKRENDMPGVLRFGKRQVPGVLRFGKRQVPGVLRFGKRQVPGVLRFGKRSDSDIPGVLRFGKRSNFNIPKMLRFGKRLNNNDMPGVLRFGK